ncbi:4442_t:CDS:2, partial [Paraglomus occultum]
WSLQLSGKRLKQVHFELQTLKTGFRTELLELKGEVRLLKYNLNKAKYTITSALGIGKQVLNEAPVANPQFFYNLLSKSALNVLSDLDLSDETLCKVCKSESDTQEKFFAFFKKLPEGPWVIHDSSTKEYFKEPNAKIDIAILDGKRAVWLHLVSVIELKLSMESNHMDAVGQLVDRFVNILEHQTERQFVIGAVACDSQIELFHMDKNFTFEHSGLLPIDFTDKTSLGLDMLVRLLRAPNTESGYKTHEDVGRWIESIPNINFSFKTLLRKRTSSRGTFVAAGTMDGEEAVFKTSATDNEYRILMKLKELGCIFVPEVKGHGNVKGEKFIVIRPFGEDLELSNHGLLIVLRAFHDIAKTVKRAAQQRIFHRDIKPTNIVLYNEHGYLIDWGIATYGDVIPMNDKLSATLAYTSMNVLENVAKKSMPSYTMDDEIESIFYTFVSVLCDDRITWDKRDSVHQLLASRFAAMYGYFDRQL